MTVEERYALVEEAFVRELAQRVVQRLVDRQKRALVVYTGSNIGTNAALESMRMLRADGFTFQVLFSRSAAKILDVDAIRTTLEPEVLWIDQPGDSPEALTVRYDTILVPALTVNTAAHVATCMPSGDSVWPSRSSKSCGRIWRYCAPMVRGCALQTNLERRYGGPSGTCNQPHLQPKPPLMTLTSGILSPRNRAQRSIWREGS